MLEIRSVRKSFVLTPVLHDVSLTLGPGEIVGLFGENGAGKTTLMKCILGLLQYRGEILLDGEPVSRKNIGRLSYATCDHSFFPAVSAQTHLEFFRAQFPKFREKRFRGLMDFFELPMHKALEHFSMGQQNQFEVILALSQGADYILLDEPFAGNDVFNREDFYKVLLGILEPTETILLSTHLLEEVSTVVSRAVLLRQGEILGDTSVLDLEDSGESLMDYVKRTYHYQADRVSKALSDLTEPE